MRLHPGSKAVVVAGAIATVLLLPAFPLFLVGALALAVALIVGGTALRRVLAWTLPFAAFNVLLLGLTWPGVHAVWEWRGFVLTEEGLIEGVAVTLRALLALLAGLAYQATTPPPDVLRALHRFPRLAMVSAATLRFMPLLREDARTLADAQRLRGRAALAAGGLRAAAAAAPLAAPLVVRTVRRGHHLQEALHAAAFDPAGGRVPYARLPWRGADTALVLLAVALPLTVAVLLHAPGVIA